MTQCVSGGNRISETVEEAWHVLGWGGGGGGMGGGHQELGIYRKSMIIV